MPGFYISNIKDNYKITDLSYKSLSDIETIVTHNYQIQRITNNKFIRDKIFHEDDDSIIVIDGVVLNKQDIIKEYKGDDFISSIKNAYSILGDKLPSICDQAWSGAYFDKVSCKWVIFTSPTGDKPIFYFNFNQINIVSSNLLYIYEYLRSKNHIYSLDKIFVYDLLTYGYSASDTGSHTPITEIRRLLPGEYIIMKNSTMLIDRYHSFNNTDMLDPKTNEIDIINQIDKLFQAAINREYLKDIEYGYTHFTSLSGGLDSRMNLFVASKLGYSNILASTFGYSKSLDVKIAYEIASSLNLNWIFYSLDNPKLIDHVEIAIVRLQYLSDVTSVIHSLDFDNNIDFSNIGLLHSGQLGDVILGTFNNASQHNHTKAFSKSYSKLLSAFHPNSSIRDYQNNEMFMLYTRGFLGALSSHISKSYYYETVSPFLDKAFFEYCMKIPLKLRNNHYIYKKWIINKYPELIKFKWERTKSKINISKISSFIARLKTKGIINIIIYLLNKVGLNIKYVAKRIPSMNPYDHWYSNNHEFKKKIHNLFDNNIDNVVIDNELKNHLCLLFNNGNTREKLQVISCLLMIRNLFNEDKNYE